MLTYNEAIKAAVRITEEAIDDDLYKLNCGGDGARGETKVCVCDLYERGASTGGWFCPIHGQQI